MCITPLVAWRGAAPAASLRAVGCRSLSRRRECQRWSSRLHPPRGDGRNLKVRSSSILSVSIPFLSISVHIRSCPGQQMSTQILNFNKHRHRRSIFIYIPHSNAHLPHKCSVAKPLIFNKLCSRVCTAVLAVNSSLSRAPAFTNYLQSLQGNFTKFHSVRGK